MDFGAIIKRSWQITWKYRPLWILGIFAGVSGCQGSSGSNGGSSNWDSGSGTGGGGMPDWDRFVDLMRSWLPGLIAAGLFILVLWLLWSILGVAARGGLVVAVNDIEEGRSRELSELWRVGFGRFWPIVGLEILLQLPLIAVGLLMLVVVLAPFLGAMRGGGEPGAEALVPICGSLVVGVPVLIVLSFVLGVMYLIALRYMMLGGQGVMESAGNSWKFLRARLKDTFLMYLINGGLNIAASLALAIPMVIIGIAVAIPLVGAIASERWSLVAAPLGLALLVAMLVSALYNGIWGLFTSSLWTLFFRKVSGMEQPVQQIPVRPSPAGAYAGSSIGQAGYQGGYAPGEYPQAPPQPPAEPGDYSATGPSGFAPAPQPPAPPAADAGPPQPPAPPAADGDQYQPPAVKQPYPGDNQGSE